MDIARWLALIRIRAGMLFRRRRAVERLDDELRFHLDRQIDEYVAAGMPREDTHQAAMRTFGNVTRLSGQTMDTWGGFSIEGWLHDLRYGARALRQAPLFTAAAVATLTLGIGATTAVFSAVQAVLLRPLSYPEPRRIVSVFEDLGELGFPRMRVSAPTYVDLAALQGRLFEHVAAINETGFTLRDETGAGRTLAGALVTSDLFAVLGVEPLIGAGFRPDEIGLAPIMSCF